MKIITFRCILTLLILLGLRFVYTNIYNVPFFEQIFICTSIGFIFSKFILFKHKYYKKLYKHTI